MTETIDFVRLPKGGTPPFRQILQKWGAVFEGDDALVPITSENLERAGELADTIVKQDIEQ